MKNTGLIILLVVLLPGLAFSQDYSHKVVVNSQGGDASTGGSYTNYVVLGQTAQDSVAVGATVQTSVGFLYAADDTFGSTPPCFIPMGFDLTALDPDQSANFTWSAEAGLSYEYRFIDITTDIETASVESAGQVSALQLTGLASGTGYQIQLRSVCGGGNTSEWTQPLFFETFGLPDCLAPQDVEIETGGTAPNATVTLNWFDEPKDENGGYPQYFVRYRSAEDTDWTIDQVTNPLGVLGNQTYVATNVSAGIYQVQVGKQCSVDINPVFGNSLLFEIGNSCQTTELSFIDATESSLRVTWNDVAADAYLLRFRRLGTFEWSTPVQVPGTETEYEVFSLDDGASYEIQLKVACNPGESPWSPSLLAETLGIVCQIPDVPEVLDVQETSIGVSWQSTNALYYDVRYRSNGSVAWNSAQTFDNFLFVDNLTGNTLYEFEVASVCEFGEPGSLFSDRIQILTLPATTICDIPSNVAAAAGVNDGEIIISWDDVSVLAYEVRFRLTTSNIWNTRLLLGSNTSVELVDLIERKNYEYQVRSRCGDAGEIKSEWTALGIIEAPGQECVSPTLVSATGNGTAIDLVFSNVAQSYFVRFRPAGFPFWNTVPANGAVNGANYEASLTGLEPGVTYQISIASACGPALSSYSVPIGVDVPGAVCETPFVSGISPTIGGVSIDWNDVASNYQIRYRLKGSSAWSYVVTAASEFASSSLQPGMFYQFQVRALCSALSISEFSLIQEFETGGIPACDVPIISSAVSGESSITLEWSNASGALYYVVQYRQTGTAFWNTRQVFDHLDPAVYSYTIGALQSGTGYQYRIQSVCDQNGVLKSAFSPLASIATQGPVACEVPTGLVITTTTTTATLNWTNGAPGLYQLRWRKAGELLWSTSTYNIGGILGLLEATAYEYQVRQVCGSNQFSDFTPIQNFTTEGSPCETPTLILLSSVDEVEVQIVADGQVGSAATEIFEYQYRLLGTTAWTLGSVPIGNTAIVNAGVVTFDNLLPGESYQIRAKAVCDAAIGNASGFTAVQSFVFPGTAVPCVVPTGLQLSSATPNSAILTWDDFDGPYDLQYQPNGAFSWITLMDVATNSVELTGLQPATSYRWRVRATCSTGANTAFSPVSFFTTEDAPDPAPFAAAIEQNEGNSTKNSGEEKVQLSGDGKALIHSEALLDNSQSLAELSVTTYPNPFRDRLLLRIRNPYDAELRIDFFNMAGVQISQVFEGMISADQSYELTVDGSLLSPGIYLVVFNGLGNQRIVKRVILER